MANTPKPITREEMYYDYLINGGDLDTLPEPITRREIYLHYLCVNGFGGGSVTPEQIQAAVDAYLEANPVEPGATEEQAAQIEENKENIEELQESLEKVFTSVSDGKELIASAITDKGVETDAKDTFATMAQNISDIQTGGGGEYDFYEGSYNLVPKAVSQAIETKDKVMKDNVTVAEIPFHEVSNETGTTVVIGGIV